MEATSDRLGQQKLFNFIDKLFYYECLWESRIHF